MDPTAIPHPTLKAIAQQQHGPDRASLRYFPSSPPTEGCWLLTKKDRGEELISVQGGFSAYKVHIGSLLPSLRTRLKQAFRPLPSFKHWTDVHLRAENSSIC